MEIKEIEIKIMSSIILLMGFVIQSVNSQLNVWSNPPNQRLSELCSKSVPMNRISRSFLCHLLPALNIQFEWNDQNKKEELAQFNSNMMPEIIKSMEAYNQELTENAEVFPKESHLYYTLLPEYSIPQTFPITRDVFPSKLSNEMQSNAFEDINQFDSSEQIEDHILNTFNGNGLIERPLIFDKNILLNPKLNESVEKWPSIPSAHYFEDFTDKRERKTKTDSSKSLFFGTNDSNKWKPLPKITENPRENKLVKNDRQIDISDQKTFTPQTISWPQSEISSAALPSNTSSATKITIPSFIRRKYLLDLNRKEEKVIPHNINYYLKNFKKNSTKDQPKTDPIKDWSMKITKNSSNWFPTLNKKMILQNKPENEIIVRKMNSNSKNSSIYSIDDSFEDKTIKTDLKDKNEFNFNRIEVKTISKVTKNDMNKQLKGRPGIDYPTYSSSVLSNFKCNGPGFYADTQFHCQVYHHCEEHDYHQKFICPNGTLFNVRIQSCDYWFNVKCDHNSKKELLIDDFNNHFQKNIKTDILREKPIDRKLIEDIKTFVENISKVKH